MRIIRIVMMALLCMMLASCVTPPETIPPETHAELIRLGRIITDETRGREERKKCMTRFREIILTAIEEYGPYAVSRGTIVEALNLDDDSKYFVHVYTIDNGNHTYYMLIIDYDNRYLAFVRRAVIHPEATT